MAIERMIGQVIKMLPKLEGSAARVTLSGKQINEFIKRNGKETDEVVQKLLSGAKNPQLDVAYKVKSDIAIAGMRVRDGEKVLGSAAASLDNIAHTQSQRVLKFRGSIDDGRGLSVNGYFDGTKQASIDDFSFAAAKKGGNYSADYKIGDTAAMHISANDKLLGFLPPKCLSEYTEALRNMNQRFTALVADARALLKGEKAVKGGVAESPQVTKLAKLSAKDTLAYKEASLSGFKKFSLSDFKKFSKEL